jgi:predicted amidohydrolase YtcJ
MLDRIDVHCSWVSSSVLALLAPLPPFIPGGEIVQDPGPGVLCDNAMELLVPLLPKPTVEQQSKQVRSAMAALNEVGLVGMHDAGETRNNIELYRKLVKNDSEWTVRV